MFRTILVVDDEPKIREVVHSYLLKEGYRVVEAESGTKAIDLIRAGGIDLVILDLMLPDLPGEQVCRLARQVSRIPILMLTARIQEEERIHGLTIGADDYVLKPFSPRELMARVKALLRRTQEDGVLTELLQFQAGDLRIRVAEHLVEKAGHPVSLTVSEFKLLVLLAGSPGRTFTREQLVEKVLGYDFAGDARAIDQHVKNVRQKIESDPKQPVYIMTVFGVGYRFASGEGSAWGYTHESQWDASPLPPGR